MKKQDYTKIRTDLLITILQMKTARPTCNMDDVTEIRNIVKQRRIEATRELKKLLEAETIMQNLVTHHLKSKSLIKS